MIVREALENDLPVVAAIYREELTKAPWNNEFSLEESLVTMQVYFSVRENVFLVGEADGEVVGFVVASKMRYLGGWYIFLAELFVRSDRQRSGLGSRLLGEVEARLRSPEIVGIELCTHAHAFARSFYEKKGFRYTDRILMSREF